MRHTAVIFVSLAALWAIVAQVNDALAPCHVYLWIGGLFVTFNALSLPLRFGLVASLLGGLLCDSAAAVPFGTHALLFAAAHVVLFNVRDRIPRDETAGRVVIALLVNLALFLVFSFLQITRLPMPGDAWPRLIFDLLCSQVFLALIAPWFLALQSRLIELADPVAAIYARRLD